MRGFSRLLRRNPGFFDPVYYRSNLSGLHRLLAGIMPAQHYRAYGWKHGYDPHPLFDVGHYLFVYDDVAQAKVEPLQHFIANGLAEARRPNPIFKPDLYVQAAPGVRLAEAFRHYDRSLGETARDWFRHGRLRVKARPGRIDAYARATGQTLIELPQPATEWSFPVIINRALGQYRQLHADLPQPYVAVLKTITAFPGTRLLLTEAGEILHDELASEDAAAYHDKLKAIGNCREGICTISAAYIGMTLDEALLISSDTDFNYFHLLVETIPKLALANETGCPVHVPILMQDDLHPNLRAALERAAGNRKIIYAPSGSAIEIGTAWYVGDLSRVVNALDRPSNPIYDMVVSPRAVRDAQELVLKRKPVRTGIKKIYMSRNSHYRHVANQDAFIAMLREKGFEIVDTGAMTLEQQMETMAAAGTIVAPSGAAMTNLLWCPPDTRVLILQADHPNLNLHLFTQVGQALGISVELYLGTRIYDMNETYSFHDSFEADLDVISRWCDRQDISDTGTG